MPATEAGKNDGKKTDPEMVGVGLSREEEEEPGHSQHRLRVPPYPISVSPTRSVTPDVIIAYAYRHNQQRYAPTRTTIPDVSTSHRHRVGTSPGSRV
eukprot:1640416-Rhodomonas_salina.2